MLRHLLCAAFAMSVFSAAVRAEDAGVVLLRRAQQDYLAGQTRRALRYYREAPPSNASKLGEALCLVRLREWDLARPILKKLYEVIPGDAELLAALRILNRREIEAIERELKHDPSSRREPELRRRLSDLLELNGHYVAARDLLLSEGRLDWKGAPPLSRPQFERRIRLAKLFGLTGQHLEAGITYEHAAPASPQKRVTFLAAVDEWILAREWDRARAMLAKLADDGAGADVDLRLAAIAFHTREYREALDIWERYPGVTEAKLGVALCLVELKRYEDARPRLLALYEVIPADLRLLDALRVVNEIEIEELEDRLAKIEGNDDKRYAAQERLLELYELNGHWESVEALTVAIAHRRPLKFGERLRLARAFTALKDDRRAGKAYEAAAEKSPDPRTTLMAAVDSYLAAEEWFLAKRVVERIEKEGSPAPGTKGESIAGPQPDLEVRRAAVLMHQGQLGYAQRILERYPADPLARRGMGLVSLFRKRYGEARPYLVEAAVNYPLDRELVKALRQANEEQIGELERELLRYPPSTERHLEMRERLLQLYELEGHDDEGRTLMASLGPARCLLPEELERWARFAAKSGRPQAAAKLYELVAPATADPRATLLLACDQYLAGEQYGPCEECLSHVERLSRGLDADERKAALYAATGRFTEAREVYAHLAELAEEYPYLDGDPHAAWLRAADMYLAARLWTEARRVLSMLHAHGGGADVDLRMARLLAAREQWGPAEELYRRHPEHDTRLELAYMRLAAGRVEGAKHELELLRFDNPYDRAARAGYRIAQEAGPWNVALFDSVLNYGSAHGTRMLESIYVRNVFGRAVSTLVYSHTLTSTPGSDRFSFTEDLYGYKLAYRVDPKNTVEGTVLVNRNNDTGTNNGSAVGLRYFSVLDDRWVVGAGYGRSDYKIGSTDQASLSAGYRFDRHLRMDVAAQLSTRTTSTAGTPPVTAGTNAALKAALAWHPRHRLFAVGTVFAGTRRLTYDPDEMYVFNTDDTFAGGASLLGIWQAAHQARVFAKYSTLPYTLSTTGASFTETVTTLGLDVSF